MSTNSTMRSILCGIAVCAFAALAFGDESASPTHAVSILKWDGEYGTDESTGGATAPTTSAIYSVADTGGEPRQLVGDNATYPRFSPVGDWLYFQATREGHSQIYRCRVDGRGVDNLSAKHQLGDDWNHAFGGALSADGKKLVYSVQNGTATGRLIVCDADGTNARWIAPDFGYIYMAALDRTGVRAAFSGPARGYRLLASRSPFAAIDELTPEHPDSYAPQFTPDGARLVFLRRDGDIYSYDFKSKAIRRLTEGNDYVEFRLSKRDLHGSTDGPHLSHDGKRIAYISRREGVPQVCVMNVDGSEPTQLTHRATPCGRVRWRPDGKEIAFVSFEDKYPQLFVISARGGEPRKVTSADGAVQWHDWCP